MESVLCESCQFLTVTEVSVELPHSPHRAIKSLSTGGCGQWSRCGTFLWHLALLFALGLQWVGQHGETVLHQLEQKNSALQHLLSLTETKEHVDLQVILRILPNRLQGLAMLNDRKCCSNSNSKCETQRRAVRKPHHSHLPEFTVEVPEEVQAETTELQKILLLGVRGILYKHTRPPHQPPIKKEKSQRHEVTIHSAVQ